jgi:hypothetical protein
MLGLVLALGAAAVAAVVFTVPALAGNGAGAEIRDMTNTPVPAYPIFPDGYNFIFWNGNGVQVDFAPTYYQEVITPSGVHNEMLKGIVANDSGAPVTYSAYSGFPIPAVQQCWDIANGNVSTDWLMTIDADGHYTLNCHFAPLS